MMEKFQDGNNIYYIYIVFFILKNVKARNYYSFRLEIARNLAIQIRIIEGKC